MKRASYRDAIDWLANNDDCGWIEEPQFGLSVAASAVRDVFGVDDAKVLADVRRKLGNAERARRAKKRADDRALLAKWGEQPYGPEVRRGTSG